jgi:glycosyltransferase involved in cell wall biosynthesis
MRVSLVIPLRNEEKTLAALVESIGRQTRPPDEVILVDGGSTDQTVALARKLTNGDPRYRVQEAGEATPGRGRNVGIAAASHEWIALTDAGIQLEAAWLERLTDAVDLEPGLDVVYGNYEPIVSTQFERIAALAYVPPKQLRSGARMRGPFIASSLLRRSVWQAVDGFPDLRAAEDLIFMERVQAAGFKIGWAPGATVWWQLQPSLLATFRKFVLYSKHNVWAGRQHDWHYGIVRYYLAALLLLAMAFTHSFWWLALLPLGFAVRVTKNIWTRRDGRGLLWFINPWQFFGVGLVLAAIDAATFLGWIQAIWSPKPQLPHKAIPPAGSVCEDRSSK